MNPNRTEDAILCNGQTSFMQLLVVTLGHDRPRAALPPHRPCDSVHWK